MRFDASQQMRLSQQMKLAPRMIQSMEILQMPLMELEERIEQELESNPLLEQVEPGDGEGTEAGEPGLDGAPDARHRENGELAPDAPLRIDSGSGSDDFERLDTFEQNNPEIAGNEFDAERAPREYEDFGERGSRLDGERDAKTDAMANTAAPDASMTDQLLDQWRFADVDPVLKPAGEQIIAYIEEDGYLRTPLEAIADRAPASPDATNVDVKTLERALGAVQLLLEPAGVGARDVRECLLLQVDALIRGGDSDVEGWTTVRRLIADHLDDLAQNRLPRIADKTGVPLAAVKRAIDKMGSLRLAPGRELSPKTAAIVVPDAIVEFDEDGNKYIAYLNDRRSANLRVNQEYAAMAKDRQAPRETRDFIKKNLSNAAWLLDAVEQRSRTLLRVVNAVVAAQRDYFDLGPQSLKPLEMTAVAEQLGLHVATVSRAVADKHLLTPRGVVPLRGFFSGGTQTESGEEVSWDAVKAALKDVIDAEDKTRPLSDEALAEEVKKRGIEIARRTVAKYRDQLGIPSARLRKVHV
jgi:RNA polymerase sigma-54 factor